MMKRLRIIGVFLMLCLLLAVLPAHADAAEAVASGTCGADGDNLTWRLSESGTLSISGSGEMKDYLLPGRYTGAPWYDYREQITRITFSDNVRSIGDYAFYDLDALSLDMVEWGHAMSRIGECAFANCEKLGIVYLPEELVTLGAAAFSGSGLSMVWIPPFTTSIGEEAFADCSRLWSISVSGSNPNYSSYCAIPETTTALFNKDRTVLIVCPGGARGEYIIPDGVRVIRDKALAGCRSLTSVEIPASVETIERFAFFQDSALEEIRFLGDAPEMGTEIFFDVIADVFYPAGNPTWTAENMLDYGGSISWMPCGSGSVVASGWSGSTTWSLTDDGILTISGNGPMKNYAVKDAMPWYEHREQIIAVNIEEGVTRIGSYAFYGMSALNSVNIAETVTSIGGYAFKNCTALRSAGLPAGLTQLGESAFYGGSSLRRMEIPASLWTVNPYTFKNCTALEEVIFQEGNLQKICDGAFYNTGLTYVVLPESLQILDVYAFKNCAQMWNAYLPSGLTEIREAVFYGTGLVQPFIPEGVTRIGDYAYKNCTELTGVTLPESLTAIGQSAFYGSALTQLDIPDAVTTIGSYAFKNCTALARLELPAGLRAISEACFYNCSSLESFVLPGNVTAIGDYAFRSCTALTGYESDGTDPRLESIGQSAFYGCTSLTGIGTNHGLTTIGSYAFKNCTALSMVTMSGTETSLGDSAFYGCTGLQSIVICEGMESIGDYCFANCSNMTRIHFLCDAPAIAPHAFARVTATAYYLFDSTDGWTADKLLGYGGTLTWVDDEA